MSTITQQHQARLQSFLTTFTGRKSLRSWTTEQHKHAEELLENSPPSGSPGPLTFFQTLKTKNLDELSKDFFLIEWDEPKIHTASLYSNLFKNELGLTHLCYVTIRQSKHLNRKQINPVQNSTLRNLCVSDMTEEKIRA